MAQVVRERAARLFDSLDESADISWTAKKSVQGRVITKKRRNMGRKRLDFKQSEGTGSILDAALSVQPRSSLYTTSGSGASTYGKSRREGVDLNVLIPPPWAGDSLLFE